MAILVVVFHQFAVNEEMVGYIIKLWLGILSVNEEWDDGNSDAGDGWANDCTVEDGYEWSLSNPSIWTLKWGNGNLNQITLK